MKGLLLIECVNDFCYRHPLQYNKDQMNLVKESMLCKYHSKNARLKSGGMLVRRANGWGEDCDDEKRKGLVNSQD